MSNSWFVIAIIAVAAVGIFLLYRQHQSITGGMQRAVVSDAHRDYTRARGAARVAHMSAGNREWETTSLQRNRERTERADTAAEPRGEPGFPQEGTPR